jgi:dTMP kinase
MEAAEFRHRLENEILPALWKGQIVLADRHLFTNLARNAARGLRLDWQLNAYAPLFWPDMVFYFAISAEASIDRIAATGEPTYYQAGQDVTDIDNPFTRFRQGMKRPWTEWNADAVLEWLARKPPAGEVESE